MGKMKLISVNIGKERLMDNGRPGETSGIFKTPVDRPVEVTSLGLKDDIIVDHKHHGGPDQAVYVYGGTDYAWWSKELGRDLAPGTFGDNLTISDLESAPCSIGDCLSIGAVVLQITAPRIPCGTLAARMGDPDFIERFRQAGRPGLYCRVLQEGVVRAGLPVTIEGYQGETVTIREMFRDYYEPHDSEVVIRRQLAAPIAIRDRKQKEKQLKRLIG